MQDLELTWQTLEFHIASVINKEIDLLQVVEKINKTLDAENTALTETKRVKYLKNISELTSIIINDYKKQNLILNELVDIYKYHSLHGVAIPPEREVPIRYLFELKNTNATLIENILKQKEEINNLFS